MRAYRYFIVLLVVGALALTHATAQEATPQSHPEQGIFFISDRDGRRDVYVMKADGSDIHPLINGPFEEGGYLESASLSPDGQTLAIVSHKDRSGQGVPGTDAIFLVDIQSRLVVRLFNEWGDQAFPAWSPDGKSLAFLSGNELNGYAEVQVFNMESGQVQTLAQGQSAAMNQAIDYDMGALIRSIDWSPDGEQLILNGFTALPDAYSMLVVVDRDGSNLHRVTSNDIHAFLPVWSSTPNIVYFGCGFDGYHEICSLDLDTSQITILSDMRKALPDESHLYITRLDVSADGQLAVGIGIRKSSSIYRFNLIDRSFTNIIRDYKFMNDFLGWVNLPNTNS